VRGLGRSGPGGDVGATMETPCPQKDPWVLAVVATPEDMRVPMTVRFSNQLVAELIQPFWAAWQGGEFMTDASAIANTHRQRGLAWVRQAGGVRHHVRAAGAACKGVTCPLVSEKRSH